MPDEREREREREGGREREREGGREGGMDVNMRQSVSTYIHSHHLIVPDDLNGHLMISFQPVPGTNHIAENSMTSVAKHSVPTIQLFPNPDTCIQYIILL